MEEKEKLAALKDSFSLCQEFIDLCYENSGFCIEKFFPVLRKFYEKIQQQPEEIFANLYSEIGGDEDKMEFWDELIQSALEEVKELCEKHYKEIQNDAFWSWAEWKQQEKICFIFSLTQIVPHWFNPKKLFPKGKLIDERPTPADWLVINRIYE